MFNSKIIALCFAAVAVSSGVARAEKEVAETFGLLGLPGVGVGVPGVASVGVGAPGYGYGVGPAVSVGVPGLASVGVGVGNGGVNVGTNVLGVGANVGVGVPGVVGVNGAPSVGVNAAPSVGVNTIPSADTGVSTDSHTYTTKTTAATSGDAAASPTTVTSGDGAAYGKTNNGATKTSGAWRALLRLHLRKPRRMLLLGRRPELPLPPLAPEPVARARRPRRRTVSFALSSERTEPHLTERNEVRAL